MAMAPNMTSTQALGAVIFRILYFPKAFDHCSKMCFYSPEP